MSATSRVTAAVFSLLLLAVFLGIWHLATLPKASSQKVDDEYAKLVGAQAATGQKSNEHWNGFALKGH